MNLFKFELPPSPTVRYSAAILLTCGALLVAYLTDPYVHLNAYNLFHGSVFLCAWYCGQGPAMVASFLSIAAIDFYFIPPAFTFSYAWLDASVNLVVFLAISFVSSSLSAKLNAELAAENAQRREAETALLEINQREQRRLGQDLHDGLCQVLAGVRLMAQELTNALTEPSEKALSKRIESRLSDALGEADTISRGLYPVELESNGLMAALEELSRKTAQLHALDCRLISRRAVSIEPASAATHLYRIAQEAVANAIKSGKAKRIRIRLNTRRSGIRLSVFDDGVGIGNEPLRKGMGMKIMEYRARVIHATLQYQSRSRGCTRVVCALQQSPQEELR